MIWSPAMLRRTSESFRNHRCLFDPGTTSEVFWLSKFWNSPKVSALSKPRFYKQRRYLKDLQDWYVFASFLPHNYHFWCSIFANWSVTSPEVCKMSLKLHSHAIRIGRFLSKFSRKSRVVVWSVAWKMTSIFRLPPSSRWVVNVRCKEYRVTSNE